MPNRHDVGNGQVLEALGMERGNAFLDIIANVADFRHVKPLLDLGTLNIRSTLVAGALAQFVAQGALTEARPPRCWPLAKKPTHPNKPPSPSACPPATPAITTPACWWLRAARLPLVRWSKWPYPAALRWPFRRNLS